MASFSSSRTRWLCLVGMGCLSFIHLYSITSHSSIKVSENPHSEYDELVLVEELQIPTATQNTSTTLVDEFLDKDSRIRQFMLPEETSGQFYFYPGRIWLDPDGNPIQAHGGGILYDEMSNMYYWYGECKDGPTYIPRAKNSFERVDIIGVSCYSSKDLRTWKNEGIVLKSEETNRTHDLHKSNVLERPKVVHNAKTNKYVMWMHIDNARYAKAAVGIAISDSPTGPFRYQHSKNPHGSDSRDLTVFKDEDGTAYLFYASRHSKDMHITQLTQDYLDVTNVTKVLVGRHREAPAVFRHREKYYMITSGCTGWAPNEAQAHVAESVLGPWETIGNPCVGGNEGFLGATFLAQGTIVLPMPGGPLGFFIFMADRWKPEDLRDSRYVWLPLTVKEEDANPKVSIFWHRRWKIPSKKSGNESHFQVSHT